MSEGASLTRQQFLQALRDRAVDVTQAQSEGALAGVNVARADLDGDGRIAGETELSALFDQIDRFDEDGSRQTLRTRSADGGTTRAGRAANAAMGLGRDPSPRPETMTEQQFVDRLEGLELDVQQARQRAALSRVNVRRADRNRDGVISGPDETRALFRQIDELDRNGRRSSIIRRDSSGRSTAAGDAAGAAIRTARRPQAGTSQPPAGQGAAPTRSDAATAPERRRGPRDIEEAADQALGVIRDAYEFVRDDIAFYRASMSVDTMANYLNSDQYTDEEKSAVVAHALTDVEAGFRFFDTHGLNIDRHVESRARVAQAVAEGLEDGTVTPQMLQRFARRSPDHAKRLAQSLVLYPGNARVGGALDIVGQVAREEAARDTGSQNRSREYTMVADLAHTSSRALIDARLPTAAEQQAAADRLDERLRTDARFQVRRWVVLPSADDDRKTARNQALAGMMRLADARGGDDRVEGHLRTLRPEEATALVGLLDQPGDTGADNGSPMRQLIRAYEGNDEYATARRAAITASPELLEAYVGDDPQEALALLEALEGDIAGYDDDTPGIAPEHRAAIRGLTNLLDGRADALFDTILADDTSRARYLPVLRSALSRTLMSPSTSPETKERIKEVLLRQADRIEAAEDPSVSGLRLGALLGTLQNASDDALQRGGNADTVRAFWEDFGGRFLGKAAGNLFKNDWIKAIVDPGTNTAMRPAIDAEQARAENARRFVQNLGDSSTDPNGERLLNTGRNMVNQRQQELAVQIDALSNAIEAAEREGSGVPPETIARLRQLRERLRDLATNMGIGYSHARDD